MRIFVSVASFCDPETQLTVTDALEQAARPDRVTFGVLAQVLDGQAGCYLAPTLPNVRQKIVSANHSKGVCWARHMILTELLADEEFVLQIDSHTRFARDWDLRFIEMWCATKNQRAILSCHPAPYTYPRLLADSYLPVFCAPIFDDDGVCKPCSKALAKTEWPDTPAPTWFVGGGCIFAPSQAFRDVPYDPYLYFHGEEISLAARFFTSGWDLYTPSDVLIFHNYATDTGRLRHWERDSLWTDRHALALTRLRYLLCGYLPPDGAAHLALQEIGRYTLGAARSCRAYECAAGISFKSGCVHPLPIATEPCKRPHTISYRFSLT